ncbi:serine hydrolase [Zavarzinella formosa]|uniref:serine hydrolase n=1 Tax=Zavarzinella formosa TaxID=360055 RepID=UPI00031F9277|nr:serine hydrolase [Zavarzinella formosa]
MNQLCRLLFALFISLGPVVLPLPAQEARLREIIATNRKAWDVPGVNVVAVDRTSTIAIVSDGVREIGGKPITPGVVFPLASCTKQFTTAIMASLVDEGVLAWNDPVRKYLPWFKLADPAASELVLVRDLLCHRTGLPAHDLLWYHTPWPTEEVVRRCNLMPATAPFRMELQYQSIMYMAAGLVCEKASGKPWGELVESRIFRPLGMKTAGVTQPDPAKAETIIGHRANPEGKLAAVPLYEMKTPNSAGSIHASAEDLAPWLKFLLNEGTVGERPLISAKNLRETWTPQTIIRREGLTARMNPHTEQLSYGLGWVVQDYRGHLLCQHAGFIDGLRVHITMMPKDGIAFAIFANREGTRMNAALSNQLVDHFLKLPPLTDWSKLFQEIAADEESAARREQKQLEVARRASTPPSLPLARYAGKYEHPAYGVMEIIAGKKGLEWKWNGWNLSLSHWEVNTFKIDTDNPQLLGMFISFVVADGNVRLVRFTGLEFTPKTGE